MLDFTVLCGEQTVQRKGRRSPGLHLCLTGHTLIACVHLMPGSSLGLPAAPVYNWTDDVEVSDVTELEGGETRFWEELINKYLLPLEKDPENEKKIQGELIELRNTTCLFFFLINGLFIVLVFTLQYVAQDSSNLTIKVRLHQLLFFSIGPDMFYLIIIRQPKVYVPGMAQFVSKAKGAYILCLRPIY